ncbi:hypothetical protein ACFLRM_03685 [Acidobacteriota bacterium]
MTLIAIITAIATVALARITYLYLKQTINMNKIAERNLQFQAAPKVFISKIMTHQNIDMENKVLKILPDCSVENTGGTEATNLCLAFKIKQANKDDIKKESEPAPYIFPNQKLSFKASIIKEEILERFLPKAQQSIEKNQPLLLSNDYAPIPYLDITLTYLDHDGKQQEFKYRCDYRWDQGNWGLSYTKED